MKPFCLALLLVVAVCHVSGEDFPLMDYINKPDPTYSWFDTGYRIENQTGWTGYLLNMTSQSWLTPADSDRSVWTHQLMVIVPHELKYPNVSAIYVTGGDNGQGPPKNTSEDVLLSALLAKETGTITATLFQVPNQPTTFAADPEHKPRSEDEFVAFTWVMYMRNTSRPEWVDLLPMVKSVVRAMDTVQAFAAQQQLAKIEKFIIAGASKRGWTTWLTGPVDKRVIGLVPIVMDMLNFQKNVMHMYEAYGGWTFAFEPYWTLNVTQDFGTPNFAKLAQIIDPLVYKQFLTMPKLVVDATGDEFFMPDDDHYWWGMLLGETYRLMIPNAEHSMATGLPDLLAGVQAFYMSLIVGSERPKLSWTVDQDPNSQKITLTTSTKPSRVELVFATTFGSERRDFRLIKGDTKADPCKFVPVKVFGTACLNPVIWWGEDIAPVKVSNGTYTFEASQPLPPTGWRGFFLMLHYPGPNNSSYRLTSQVSIIPNTFPFPSCSTLPSCKGVLV